MEIKSKIKKMLELLQRYKALKYVVVILVAVLIIGFLVYGKLVDTIFKQGVESFREPTENQ